MRALALAVALLPGAALAQESCGGIIHNALDRVLGVYGSGQAELLPDGWCEAREVSFQTVLGPEAPQLRLDLLRWRSDGLRSWLGSLDNDEGERLAPPPTFLEIAFEGARVHVPTGEPGFDWLLDAQTVPDRWDGFLQLRWDEARQEMVGTVALDHAGESALWADATVAGLDLTDQAALEGSLDAAALTRLTAEVTSRGLFERYLLLPLGTRVIGPGDRPELAASFERRMALQVTKALPSATFPDPTRAELAALIQELPNPWGRLSVELVAQDGLGVSQFIRLGPPEDLDALWPALEGVTVAVDWTPLPRPD